MTEKTVNIGCAAGMWGDSLLSTPQLLATKHLHYLVYESLAEITMAILTRARQRDPSLGYATDIIQTDLARHLGEMKQQGVRVITNAGGINPQAAAAKLKESAAAQGITLKVAVVMGDDLLPQVDDLREMDLREIGRGTAVPDQPISFNAYLGARPIAAALDAGAEVVITGRCVDSALVLGPLLHEFGWGVEEFDKLAQGSLAGHLLECGPQSTGGLLTDWETVPSWVNIGYPIAECNPDGSFVLTKPEGSDGAVNAVSVTEQILYEIGDPRGYILPDVVCDFADVRLAQVGEDRVLVEGVKGRPPTPYYKACALEQDGYRVQFLAMLGGRAAAQRAQRVGDSILARVRQILAFMRLADFRATSIEMLGAEVSYGPHAKTADTREVILKISAHHDKREALELLARELPSIGLGMAQGLSGGGAGRARPSPFIRLHSFLVPRQLVQPVVLLDGETVPFSPLPLALCQDYEPGLVDEGTGEWEDAVVSVPLIWLAYGRSGDKGDVCNVGIAARHPDFVAVIERGLTAEIVKTYLGHLVEGKVERFTLPGLNAFNFVCYEALAGGGTASLRFDPQGKAMAQMLLDCPIEIPSRMLTHPALNKL